MKAKMMAAIMMMAMISTTAMAQGRGKSLEGKQQMQQQVRKEMRFDGRRDVIRKDARFEGRKDMRKDMRKGMRFEGRKDVRFDGRKGMCKACKMHHFHGRGHHHFPQEKIIVIRVS